MNYTQFFNKLLLEASGNDQLDPRVHNVPEDASAQMFDTETDPSSFETTGLDTSGIEAKFEQKLSLLDDIDTVTPEVRSERMDQLQEYLGNLKQYFKQKDVDLSSDYSIMAGIIRKSIPLKADLDVIIQAVEEYSTAKGVAETAAKELGNKAAKLARSRGRTGLPNR